MTPGAHARPAGLPIDGRLDEIVDAAITTDVSVIVAPPGSGKTTRVPSALIDRVDGTVVMLEPRRVAARMASRRIADQRGTHVGEEVGYRVRGEHRTSAATRLDVVTDGVFIRTIQNDPELTGVSVVVLDEFHERSVNGDLALALARDVQASLRDDLRIVLMSATPDLGAIERSLPEAHVIGVDAPSHPVEISHVAPDPGERIETTVARVVGEVSHETSGDLLVFVPGRAEIDRVASLLGGTGLVIDKLHGSMSAGEQARVVTGGGSKRRCIVATNVAESSVTVSGVRVVIDSGLRRTPVLDQAGLSLLRTVRISRSSADQRAGRAGREAPGWAFRLWSRDIDHQLSDVDRPAIETTDLGALALEVAAWGVDVDELRWLDAPNPEAWTQATSLVAGFGFTDQTGRLTTAGRQAVSLGVGPRHAAIALEADRTGAPELGAALVAILDAGRAGDLEAAVQREIAAPSADSVRLLGRLAHRPTAHGSRTRRPDRSAFEIGRLVALGHPSMVARRRLDGRYLMANGRGAKPIDSGSDWVAVAEVSGAGTETTITSWAPLEESDAIAIHGIDESVSGTWDRSTRRARVEVVRTIGAIELSSSTRPPTADEACGVVEELLRAEGISSLDDESAVLAETIARWNGVCEHVDRPRIDTNVLCDDIEWLRQTIRPDRPLVAADVAVAMLAGVSWDAPGLIDDHAPTHLVTPLGSRRRLNWMHGGPELSAPVQEYFGCTSHPTVAGGAIAVTLHLLSPAQRPVQTTTDIAGFWQTSYQAVRKDLRGRYPKHHWPEDPAGASPAKPGRKPT